MLACLVLPQQAVAQNSGELLGSTYTISDAVATEGGTASFTVTIEPPVTNSPSAFTVSYTAGTADLDDLGSDRPTMLPQAPSGSTGFTLEVPIADDGIAEGEETFTVTVSFVTLLNIQATGTINASTAGPPPPPVDIGIDGASADEGDDIRFTVSLSAELLEPRTLDIGYTAGTGDTGAGLGDLGSARPTTLTLPIGTTSVNLDVPTAEDDLDEENETFTVTLSLPDPPADPMNTLTIATATATGTITDDDDPAPPPPLDDDAVIDLSVVADVSEAANRLNFRVDLTEKLSQAVTVAWAVTGGTASPADFDRYESSGTATIETGDDVVRIRFRPMDDDLAEGPETLELTISEDSDNPLPDGVTIGTAMATGTLIDNDPPTTPGNDATVSIGNRTVAEDVAGGNATFTVNLSAAVDSDVVLDVAVTAGAGNPVTLADDLGALLPTTVTIDQGETEASVTVPITNDAIVEGNETFTVTISEGATELPDGVTIATGEATGTITDADTAGVSLSSTAPAAASEGGTITFTVDLDNPVAEAFSLGWTASDGTAMVDDDLDDRTGTVEIDANARTATFDIPVTNDEDTEDSETFTVALTGAPTGLVNIAPNRVTVDRSSATGTIDASDDPAEDATVSIANAAAVAEGGGGNATFAVTLSAAVDRDVVLDVAYAAGTGDTGAVLDDLGSARPTTLTIPEGSTEATLTVPIVNDVIVEDEETFTVRITTATAGIGIAAGTATGTITDSDTAVVSMQGGTVRADESRPFNYFVRLGAPVSRPVTIAWTATGGTATVEEDLQDPRTGTVTFAANDNADRTFTVNPVEDTIEEEDETFTVTIEAAGTLPARVTVDPDNDSRTSTIVDNDGSTPPPVVNATVSIDSETVTENVAGGNATFTAQLSRAVASDVVLDVAVTAGPGDTATLADDLGTPLPTTVTIAANTTEATFTVPIANDDLVEGDETFTVTLSEDGDNPLPDGVTIDGGTATGMITEDDAAEVTLTANTATANENGGTFSYTVNLSAAADEAVTVRWTATAGPGDTATVDDDLRETTGTVTFAANDNADRTFTIRPVDDNEDEENETFTVTIGEDTEGNNPLPAGVTIGAADSSTATITDDDDTPVVTASISIADADPVAEGTGPARFTIALEPRALTGDVALDVAYAPGMDTLEADPATLEDLGSTRPATVRIPAGRRSVVLEVPIADDDLDENNETFTVTLSASAEQPDNPETGEPPGFILLFPRATATGTITEDEALPPPAPEPSVLIGPRLVGAGTALRRHVGRFDAMTGTVVRNRLDGRGLDGRWMKTLTASRNLGSGAVAVGGSFDHGRLDQGHFDQRRWGAWIDGAWAGFDGNATGYQADVYGGVDYLAPNGAGLIGNWLIGALIGHEVANLDIGKATYRSRYTHVGLYGGARLWQHLLFDGAVTYGRATPDIALGDVSASHDANRITARGALTGDFGLQYGLWAGSVRIEPQLGVLYSRERLGAFTDSAGGVGQGETLELGRFSAGPRLTWAFDGGRLTGGARVQWDFLELEDGVDGQLSGAADIGVTLDLAPNITLGVQGDVDGIGIGDGFGSLGGTVELKARF